MSKMISLGALALCLAAGGAFAADETGAGTAAIQALPAACGKPPTAEQLARVPHAARELSRAEIDSLLADPAHVVFIDVRRPDEITTCGGLPVYLSIQIQDLDASLAFIPRDRKIVTISNHAMRAWRSADLLASRGFNVVGAVSAEDYASAGGKLTRIVPPVRPATPSAGAPSANGSANAGGPAASAALASAPAQR